MWSLGCLTSALLSGSSYFVNTQDSEYRRDSTAAVTKAAAECNLAGIDNDIDWEEVETLAKDFIKQLLKLDEKARLSAEQALEHAWFTDGSRRIFFQESYEKIISGWTRSTPGWDFIENLDLFIDARNPQSKVRYAHFSTYEIPEIKKQHKKKTLDHTSFFSTENPKANQTAQPSSSATTPQRTNILKLQQSAPQPGVSRRRRTFSHEEKKTKLIALKAERMGFFTQRSWKGE